ncbi:MAG: hypothetical protein PHP23_07690 [Desulfobacterales bacterium]|nr:hypothetical protein [Desulfobacterales bacterium]MDD4072704.1 hypothetical protein [Desulfobacterales bacterium]MDD4393123.1 hypothetical protein [Desulfobacterales bacterium]
MDNMNSPHDQLITRRKALTLGAAAIGTAVAGGLVRTAAGIIPSANAAKNEASWPLPYVKLDPEKALPIAYNTYFKYG